MNVKIENREIFQKQKADKLAVYQKTDSDKFEMATRALKEATETGTQILKEGCNAINAIIAIQLILLAVGGIKTGIGGGGFLVFYDNQRQKIRMIRGHAQTLSPLRLYFFKMNKENIQYLLSDSPAWNLSVCRG